MFHADAALMSSFVLMFPRLLHLAWKLDGGICWWAGMDCGRCNRRDLGSLPWRYVKLCCIYVPGAFELKKLGHPFQNAESTQITAGNWKMAPSDKLTFPL